MLQKKFKKVNVGIAGQHIKSLQHHGLVVRKDSNSEINEDDINRLINDMYKLVLPPGDKILHVIPQEFIVDNEQNITDPIGMSGIRLEANFHIITGQVSASKNIFKVVEKSGLEVAKMTLEPIASASAVLSDEEKEAGVVLVDIGGGSTEVTVKNKDNILSESFRLGIVTVTQRHKTPEAIKIAVKKKMKDVKSFLDFAFNTLRKPKLFVASSGTPTTLAALKLGMNYHTYDGSKVNGAKITVEDLDYWADKLMKMEMKKREELVGVGRGDLIISGIYIFKEIFKLGKYKECIVCDDGLREGVAIDECKMENEKRVVSSM